VLTIGNCDLSAKFGEGSCVADRRDPDVEGEYGHSDCGVAKIEKARSRGPIHFLALPAF
jgi:hypothetical protein